MNADPRRRWPLVAGLALAAAGLLWLTFARPLPPIGPDPSDSAVGAAIPSPAASAPLLSAGSDSRAAAPALAVGPRPAGGEALRVHVRRPGGAVVAGAIVRVHGDDAALHFPPTGADGSTTASRFPWSSVRFDVRHDGWSGRGDWTWNAVFATEVTVWMRRDRDVEVRVRTVQGEPVANAPVTLGAEDRTHAARPDGITDAGGWLRTVVPGTVAFAHGPSVRAVAVVGGRPVPSAAAPWADDGPTRLEIEVPPEPPGTALTVRFAEPDTAAAHVRGTLQWSRVLQGGAVIWPGGIVEVDGTTARLAPLTPGEALHLELREVGRSVTTLQVPLPAASSHEVTMQRGAVAPRLEIPLVDANGASVADAPFRVFAALERSFEGVTADARTDAHGVLAVWLPASSPGAIEVARPRAADRLHWPTAPGLPRPYSTRVGPPELPDPVLGVATFPAVAPGAVLRLAPMRVPAFAAMVHGRVVDAAGAPAAGVRLGLTSVDRPAPRELAGFATVTAADGRFTIQATALPAEVYVFGRRPLGYVAAVRVRTAGAAPLELTLQPTGAVALHAPQPESLRSAPRIARAHVVAELGRERAAMADGEWGLFADVHDVAVDAPGSRWSVKLAVPPDGALTLRDLVPGAYELHWSIGPNVLGSVSPLLVRAGATTEVAAAANFGDAVELAAVRVLAPGGPLENARVACELPQWTAHPQGLTVATDIRGEAWFVVPRGAAPDVTVTAPGFAVRRIPAARLPLDVMMGSGGTLAIAIAGHESVLADVRALVVSCAAHAGTPPDSPVYRSGQLVQLRHPQAQLDASGAGAVVNLPPGRYRVWLAAWPARPAPGGPTFVLLGDHEIRGDERIDVQRLLSAADLATLRGR